VLLPASLSRSSPIPASGRGLAVSLRSQKAEKTMATFTSDHVGLSRKKRLSSRRVSAGQGRISRQVAYDA
jgi:hypothetical protein